jgi:pimeloyl-ACP methyl ester carboxylesterase
MAVMRYHPDGVARAVLTGMEGPDHTYDMPGGVLAALERLAAEAELSNALMEHVPEGGFIEALRRVITRLESDPVMVDVGGESLHIDADDVRDAALGYTSRTSSRQGARTWPADVLALHRGQFEGIARAKRGEQGPQGPRGLPTASFFMLDCGSGISPARLETLQNDPAIAVVGDLGRWYQTTCSAWDADLGEAFRAGFVTDIPTVIVQGSWDTSTPLENAIELLPSFVNMHFVLVDGGSHGALGEAIRTSPEFAAALMGFIATGDMGELPLDVRLPPLDWAAPH